MKKTSSMQSSYLLLNDIRSHFLYWGIDTRLQPALLLHGLASNARIWEAVAPLLLDAGLAPIALDARGHGLTDKPDGDYGIDTFLRDLVTFVDSAHLEKPLLVGHSWGGILALEYAARFSFGARAPAGLVLVDGGFTQMDQFPGANWEQMRERLTPPKLAGMPVEKFISMLSSPSHTWLPGDQAIQAILANFEISEQETISPHLSLEHHMQILRAIWEHQTQGRFQRVRCPVMIVAASPPGPLTADDETFLEFKRRAVVEVESRMENLRVHWMQDTIHDIPLQRPAELAGLIAEFASQMVYPG